MKIKIATLTENTAATYAYLAEWGQSLLIEIDGKRILFDTGRSITAAHNAGIMKTKLSSIDCIVLSHGHQDHTGGLREVLGITGKVEIIAHPDIWAPKYVVRSGSSTEERVDIPFSRGELERLGASFRLTRQPFQITEHMMTSGEIPLETAYEQVGNNFYIKQNGQFMPDPMADDMALFVNADFGLVVIAGCAHRGIINTIRHAQKLTGKNDVYAVIGGTHLFGASAKRIRQTIADLKTTGIRKLGVSHCTGFNASAKFASAFPNAFFLNNAGTQFTLP